MAKSVLLEVITPSELFYKSEVEMVVVKTLTGEEGFMANHTWACKLLDIGELWILEPGAVEHRLAAISGGYIDVKQNFVIYTDSAEWAEDIDTARALQRKEELEGWLCCHNLSNTDAKDIARAKISLTKQLTRMHAAEGGSRRKR